jgi:hypothetical protein
MEKVVIEKRPDVVLHAHAHRGRASARLARAQRSLEDFSATTSDVVVINVSLPARGGVTFFEIGREDHGVKVSEL